MLKRAQFYYHNPCSACEEAKSFLEDNGVILEARDLDQKPLLKHEIREILRNFDTKHFLDSASPSYTKVKLDKKMPPRGELFEMLEKHPDLLKHPIVVYGRLITVGAGRKQLIDMFQITVSNNGSDKEKEKVEEKAAKRDR